MHYRIAPLVTQASELADKWRQLLNKWGTAGLPDEKPYSRLHGASFKEFSKRIIATLDLIAALGQVDEAGQLLFLPKVDAAQKHLEHARNGVEKLLSELNSQPLATFRVPDENLDVIQGFVNGSHAVNVNAGTHFNQISANMVSLFDAVSTGLRVGKDVVA